MSCGGSPAGLSGWRGRVPGANVWHVAPSQSESALRRGITGASLRVDLAAVETACATSQRSISERRTRQEAIRATARTKSQDLVARSARGRLSPRMARVRRRYSRIGSGLRDIMRVAWYPPNGTERSRVLNHTYRSGRLAVSPFVGSGRYCYLIRRRIYDDVDQPDAEDEQSQPVEVLLHHGRPTARLHTAAEQCRPTAALGGLATTPQHLRMLVTTGALPGPIPWPTPYRSANDRFRPEL